MEGASLENVYPTSREEFYGGEREPGFSGEGGRGMGEGAAHCVNLRRNVSHVCMKWRGYEALEKGRDLQIPSLSSKSVIRG